MMRGSLSNTLSSTLWIHSDVLLRQGKRVLFVGPHRYTTQRDSWLWAVSYLLKPVVIYIGNKPHPLLDDYDHLYFDDFSQARTALRRDYRAVEMVVNDPSLVCDGCTLFESNLKRYC